MFNEESVDIVGFVIPFSDEEPVCSDNFWNAVYRLFHEGLSSVGAIFLLIQGVLLIMLAVLLCIQRVRDWISAHRKLSVWILVGLLKVPLILALLLFMISGFHGRDTPPQYTKWTAATNIIIAMVALGVEGIWTGIELAE